MTLTPITGGANIPLEPDWSGIFADELAEAEAAKHWREIIAEMCEAQTAALVNGHTVQRLVQFRIEFDRAARNVAEQGKIIRAKRTKAAMINPEWTCMKQAAEAASDIEAELGLSPRRRAAAAKVSRVRKKPTAVEQYLRPVSR